MLRQYRLNRAGSFDHRTVILGSGAGPRFVSVCSMRKLVRVTKPAVEVHAADALGRPVRVPAEQRVILRRAQEAHDPKLLHQLVDQLLGARLGQLPSVMSRSR